PRIIKGHHYYKTDDKLANKAPYNWQLTEQYKTILGYKCRLAVDTTSLNKGAYSKHKIKAWFTNDIPIKAGPGRYFRGLPGMVLAVKTPGRYYYAQKIKLNAKLNFPPDSRFLSEKQLADLLNRKP